MKRPASLLILVALVLVSTLPALAGSPPPRAREVIVRGVGKLSDAVAAATLDAWRDPAASRPVAVVVDVTPFTMLAEPRIRTAFEALGDRIPHLSGSWRIAPLGGRFGGAVRHPSALNMMVGEVLAGETDEVNTLAALEKTLGTLPERNAVVLYLADWRFEDDAGLPGFIGRLRGRGMSLRVIGSEACFSRGWNDGFYPPDYGQPGPDGPRIYATGIGRRPFGPEDSAAPWHGGDTAYPHLPPRFWGANWSMEFPYEQDDDVGEVLRRYARERRGAGGIGEPEDLAARLKDVIETKRMDTYVFPVSSSFGPYSLMRAAGATGGRYWLYFWNPLGRTDLVYDYGRCNLFPPDLRSRREILADLPHRPPALAMLRAWHLLGNRRIRIADATPPVSADGRAPLEMRISRGGRGLSHVWPGPEDHQRFLAAARLHIEATDQAISMLRAARGPARPRDEVDARLRADADLFLHILLVLRLELKEAFQAALGVGDEMWSDPELMPGLEPKTWIGEGRDPDFVPVTRAKLFHPEDGAVVLESRKDHLRRYLGTPFGEIVARNSVVTYRPTRMPVAVGIPSKRAPSESGADRRPTPGGSGGGGPASGK